MRNIHQLKTAHTHLCKLHLITKGPLDFFAFFLSARYWTPCSVPFLISSRIHCRLHVHCQKYATLFIAHIHKIIWLLCWCRHIIFMDAYRISYWHIVEYFYGFHWQSELGAVHKRFVIMVTVTISIAIRVIWRREQKKIA